MRVYHGTLALTLDDNEPEYVERKGRLCIDRVVKSERLDSEILAYVSGRQRQKKEFSIGPALKLSIASPGLLDTLEFIEDDEREALAHDEVEIETVASGVNFKDCLIALGRVPGITMGFECAGVVRRVGASCTDVKPGDRVCTSALGTYQTYVRNKENLTLRLPPGLSFTDGAASPTNCITAYYALVHVAHLKSGESILIHSASGKGSELLLNDYVTYGAL